MQVGGGGGNRTRDRPRVGVDQSRTAWAESRSLRVANRTARRSCRLPHVQRPDNGRTTRVEGRTRAEHNRSTTGRER